jgi:two-component system, sensor histidine kinase and response regulator
MQKKFSASSLRSTHLFILGAIAILLLVGQSLIQYSLYKQVGTPKAINIAGRQRMLSQELSKAAILAVQMSSSREKRWSYVKELEETLNTWEDSYKALKGGSSELKITVINSPLITKMFEDLDPEFQTMAGATRKLIEELIKEQEKPKQLNEHVSVILNDEKTFLKKMDKIVSQYASEATARIDKLRTIELIFFIAMLVCLIYTFVFYLIPAETDVNETIEELEKEKNQIKEAQESAETATKLKNKFLASLSHEIRTPMNGIVGMTSLILDTHLNEDQRDYADSINKSASSVITIVDDILDLSQFDKSQFTIETGNFDLRVLLEDVIELLSVRAEEKDMELILDYGPNQTQSFLGDSKRIRQIVTNIVSNAIEVSNNEHVLVRVSTKPIDDYKSELRVEVRDNGNDYDIGRMKELHEEDLLLSNVDLIVCKQLTDLMGGKILVESTDYDFGFCYTLKLTLPHNKNLPNQYKFNSTDVHVFILDKDPVYREIVQLNLSECGLNSYCSVSASGLNNQLQDCKATHRIVIFNQDTPDLQVEPFISKLRNEKVDLIIVSTPRRHSNAKKYVSKDKVAASLSKPLRLSKLLAAISEILDEQNQQIYISTEKKVDGPKVLIVEDNIVNQKVAVCMLEKLGCMVDKAENGIEALELIKKNEYQIIFMDCQMPEMDGYDATKAIRIFELETQSHVPIIAMTANVMQRDRERCFEVGMDGFMSKPIDTQDLREALKHFLNKDNVFQVELEEEPVLIQEVLQKLRNLKDEKFLEELFDTFLKKTVEGLSELSKALEHNDLRKLQITAQKLKGSSVDIGAKRISDICRELESIDELSSLNKMEAFISVNQLHSEFERVKAKLRAEAII